jgi:methionine aminotransferase
MTIFSVMSKLATETGAINLSQGFPDFPISEKLVELVSKHMRAERNQYAPMPGVPVLRDAIAQKMENLYSVSYDPNKEITVTAGATQAIFTAISTFVNEGDEVVVFEPAYDCYVPAIELHGGKPVYVQMDVSGTGPLINWDQVQKLVNQRTKMVIINTPHNPSGRVMTAQDLLRLEKLTKDSDIIILSDEVYEHIIFDGAEHQSVSRFPKLAERSIIVDSFGKTYHNTGWKVGYVLAPEELTKEFRKTHQYNVFSVNTPVQYALADYMQDESLYLGLAEFYQEKRDTFNRMLEGSRFTVESSAGTYFQLLGYSKISSEPDTEMAIRLTKEIGVASIPISVFFHEKKDDKLLRFCFAKGNETLEQAAEKLLKL